MNNIAIIPARGGSKRLHSKNILPLAGLPLIAHSILYAKENSNIIGEVYVSTNDSEIKEVALQYGAKVIDRPEELSGDFEPTVTSLKHVLQSIGGGVDQVFLLQATNPLRPKNLIQEAFTSFQKANADSLMTVTRNHQKFGKIVNEQFIPFNYVMGQRSQDLEPLYFENGLLYICKSELIMNEMILGKNNFPLVVNHVFAQADIDTAEDFEYAEYLFNKYNLK